MYNLPPLTQKRWEGNDFPLLQRSFLILDPKYLGNWREKKESGEGGGAKEKS